ncbi:MAG TPA: AAA family ATPase, partial [Fervidobacterium sp.]|nr:AAA family ATPase [Fervidobacterium sp.]
MIVGPNASGKTNILEALSMLCGWGQARRTKLKDLINWYVYGEAKLYSKFSGEEEISVLIKIGEKRSIKISGKQGNASILRVHVPSLSFWCDDVHLIEGPPAVRRNFLNKLCAVLVPLYARKLYDYKKLLRHRNYCLRKGQPDGLIIKAMAPLAAWL